jgi:hypothetical protein
MTQPEKQLLLFLSTFATLKLASFLTAEALVSILTTIYDKDPNGRFNLSKALAELRRVKGNPKATLQTMYKLLSKVQKDSLNPDSNVKLQGSVIGCSMTSDIDVMHVVVSAFLSADVAHHSAVGWSAMSTQVVDLINQVEALRIAAQPAILTSVADVVEGPQV